MSARPWAGRKLHLIGIGGAGMSGWARVAAQLGAQVSGSDRADGPVLDRLRRLGIEVHVGHAAANVPEGAEIFHSTAIAADNPERTIVGNSSRPRAELLHEFTTLARVIAIAGAHGKTTTAAMVTHALLGAGIATGYMIGGVLTNTGENADWGDGRWLVIEADESDRSMLALAVDIAVVLNIELDHHATFAGSQAQLEADFELFRTAAATVIAAPEIATAGEIVFDPGEVELTAGGSRFSWRGQRVELKVPGRHNAANAAAALEACVPSGADEAALAAALASFTGVGRRFQRLGRTATGALVVDDYAHHPTEVAATIAAARSLAVDRIVACFQPHLFSRTREFAARFGQALASADVVVVTDIYPARERSEDFPGVSALAIAEACVDAGCTVVWWLPQRAELKRRLAALAGPEDLLLMMGAGDIDSVAGRLVI